MHTTFNAALQLRKLGISIIPVHADGSKRPIEKNWDQYMKRLCSKEELVRWFDHDDPAAIGIVCGTISHNLVCVDIDDKSLIEPFEDLVSEADLIESLVVVETGSGKRHYYYQCESDPGPRQCLAFNPPEKGKTRGKVAIESRANGCMTIAPGSPVGTHPNGKLYRRMSERAFKDLKTLSDRQRRQIHHICRSLTRWQSDVQSEFNSSKKHSDLDPTRPGDDFNMHADWGIDVLEPIGFALVNERGDLQYWRRPEATSQWSVSTGIKSNNGRELMRVFSTNTEYFDADRSYDKFGAYAAVHHDGNIGAAAAALAELGYGGQQRQDGDGESDRIVLLTFSGIRTRPIGWLWKHRIPTGKLVVVSGDPGVGKSFFFCDLASRVSTGRSFPDLAKCKRGGVLILSCEDDPGDTLRPRLEAHGADLARVHFLTVETFKGEYQQFDIKRHLDQLGSILEAHPDARLLVFDPLTAYMGDIDSNSNTEVRRVLGPLCELAQEHSVAVIGVSHLTKKESRAVARTLGSMAFVAASRASWIITRDKKDKNRRLFLQAKNNLADAPGLAFRIKNGAVQWEPEPVHDDVDDATIQTNGNTTRTGGGISGARNSGRSRGYRAVDTESKSS